MAAPFSSRPSPASPAAPSVSVILPCWRDAARLEATIARLQTFRPALEIIAALSPEDGGLVEAFRKRGISACRAARLGRGGQLNAGAALATGEILLFHHVDSHLTPEHLASLRAALQNPSVVGGAFHRAFDDRHPHLRRLEPLERWHCRWFGTLYGDQSLFVRRAHFERLGGFRDFPLMEDVEFSARLRRSGRVAVLDPPMTSSPRRHLERGAWRTTLRNLQLLLLFHAGVSPRRLHALYYGGTRRAADESGQFHKAASIP